MGEVAENIYKFARSKPGMFVLGGVGTAAIIGANDIGEASSHKEITEIIQCNESTTFELNDDKSFEMLGFTDERSNGKDGYAGIMVAREEDGMMYAGTEALGPMPNRAFDKADPANYDIGAEDTHGLVFPPRRDKDGDVEYVSSPTMSVLGGKKNKDIRADFEIIGDEERQEVYLEIDCDERN